jgi:hypothetical protein
MKMPERPAEVIDFANKIRDIIVEREDICPTEDEYLLRDLILFLYNRTSLHLNLDETSEIEETWSTTGYALAQSHLEVFNNMDLDGEKEHETFIYSLIHVMVGVAAAVNCDPLELMEEITGMMIDIQEDNADYLYDEEVDDE